MRTHVIVPLLLAPMILAWPVSAKSDKGRSYSIEIETGFNTTYDDNVFRRTNEERDEFKNAPNTGKWENIETIDDLINAVWVQGTYSQGNTRIIGKAKQYSYWQNWAKSFHLYSLNIRRTLGKRFYGYLDYRYVPRYYIRQIYSEVTRDYEAYDYAKHRVALEFRKGLLKKGVLWVRGHARYEHEDYPESFDEYDFDAYAFEAEASYKVNNDVKCGAEGLFRSVNCVGYVSPRDTGEIVDLRRDSDASYEENTLELYADYDLPAKLFGRTPTLGVRGSVDKKVYTTDISVYDDPYHAGREDLKYGLRVDLSMSFSYGMSALLEYEWQERTVESESEADLGEEKDFTSNAVSLEISFEHTLLD